MRFLCGLGMVVLNLGVCLFFECFLFGRKVMWPLRMLRRGKRIFINLVLFFHY